MTTQTAEGVGSRRTDRESIVRSFLSEITSRWATAVGLVVVTTNCGVALRPMRA